MKNFKKLLVLLLAVLLIVPVSTYAQADVKIWVDGDFIDSDVDPYIEDGRTLVPIRVISESLGYNVTWDADTRTVGVSDSTDNITLKIDDNNAVVNNESRTLDVPATLKDSRTFVPIRFIAETFNKNVDWDHDNRVAVIGDGYVPAKSTNTFEQATVTRVVDGDTIIVDRGRGDERLRFILVDTPETVHPNKPVELYGQEASDYTKSQLEGKTVYLQKDVSETDRYNRLLRYVWIARPSSNNPTEQEITDKMFNAILLKEGYAQLSTFPPDVKYVDHFRELQKQARDQNRGLWQFEEYRSNPDSNPVDPNAKKKTGSQQYTDTQALESAYTGNKNSLVFHRPTCSAINRMSPANRVPLQSRDDAVNKGYKPCGICKP